MTADALWKRAMTGAVSKRDMGAYLEAKGWRAVRKRGEPVWFRDPLGLQGGQLRIEDAYRLQLRRDASGILGPT